MKRVVLLIVVAGVLLLCVVAVLRKGSPRPVTAQPLAVPPPVAVTNAPAVSNPSRVSVVPPPLRQAQGMNAATPAESRCDWWGESRGYYTL